MTLAAASPWSGGTIPRRWAAGTLRWERGRRGPLMIGVLVEALSPNAGAPRLRPMSVPSNSIRASSGRRSRHEHHDRERDEQVGYVVAGRDPLSISVFCCMPLNRIYSANLEGEQRSDEPVTASRQLTRTWAQRRATPMATNPGHATLCGRQPAGRAGVDRPSGTVRFSGAAPPPTQHLDRGCAACTGTGLGTKASTGAPVPGGGRWYAG